MIRPTSAQYYFDYPHLFHNPRLPGHRDILVYPNYLLAQLNYPFLPPIHVWPLYGTIYKYNCNIFI